MYRWFVPIALLLAGGLAGAQEAYRLDPTGSDIHWRVYSAGAFARLGHNHVISAGAMSGDAEVTAAGEVRFTLEMPVGELVVDDPELRRRYGDAFSSEPSPADIAGTRRNMLGEAVLNAEQHPTITVTGRGPLGDGATVMLDLSVEVAGHTADIEVPASVRREDDVLVAEGEFQLTHTALGMQPFSVMLGALQVADHMDFSYRVRAERSTAAAESPPPRE